jgi:hypothetical protein
MTIFGFAAATPAEKKKPSAETVQTNRVVRVDRKQEKNKIFPRRRV